MVGEFPENLDGFHYHYKVSGTNLDATTAFDAQEPQTTLTLLPLPRQVARAS